ncbi:dTMP kinase [Siccirubricoccus sp. KC 17139]|uniref:Thymidylate kinase n=1 Tax=Siccirubricoccus soli TaxID=2899147 RepID=A0ABT1D2W2_9PROT|nr:dTMP kinase [Siccirubricoccus soli]MCP2682385.1 dTMP kinase [Siccirubricoccus soli]
MTGSAQRGRFITLEGGEGAGKSTQARRLAAALAEAGLPVLLTREPGGAPGAEAVRGLILSRGFDPIAECLLHFVARREHVARLIAPALAAGIWVVCDRFADSTFAYQVHGQGVTRPVFEAIAAAALGGLAPDLTLMLEVPEALGLERALRRGEVNRYDRLDDAFHARVRAGFATVLAENPGRCVRIDAAPPADAVTDAILVAVRSRLLPP